MRSEENICQHCRRQRRVATLSSNAYTHQTRFFKQQFYKQCQAEIGKKSGKCQATEAELLLFENYSPSSSRHHRKIIRLGY